MRRIIFAPGEGQRVLEQDAHEPRALLLHRRTIVLGRERGRRIGVARRRRARQSVEKALGEPATTTPRPARESSRDRRRARPARPRGPILGEKGEQQIADHRADVEADRADEGEFGVDDARVVRRRP